MMLSGRCFRNVVSGSTATIIAPKTMVNCAVAHRLGLGLHQQRRQFSFVKQDQLHQFSLKEPERFWGEASKLVSWDKPVERVLTEYELSSGKPYYKWFDGGKLNACYNAVDRHLESKKDQAALIYDSPVTSTQQRITYGELHQQVSQFAGFLASKGVVAGDRVVIYMPMIPEAVVAILACSRLGAIHSIVFGGFAPEQLASRVNHAAPKALITASCGIEGSKGVLSYKPLVDRALQLSEHKPSTVVMYQRPQLEAKLARSGTNPWEEYNWADEVPKAKPAPCVSVDAGHPIYVLYTSGTTGNPKGVVRDTGGYVTALNWSLPNVFGVSDNDVWWAASDIGWVVGISYIVYAPLIYGATSVLYEGKPVGTPDAGAFWRVIADHKVHSLFTAPTAFRAIKKEDPRGEFVKKYDLSKFENLWLAGERADIDTIKWAQHILDNRPVIDNWWQTETGWPIAATCIGMGETGADVKPGYVGKAVPGYDVQVLDPVTHKPMPFYDGSDTEEAIEKAMGDIVIKLPLPPGTLTTLFKEDAKFYDVYLKPHPGYYHTGDSGIMDADGYISILARTDDIINTAGHRLSTGALEEALSSLESVAECAVIGVKDAMKGEIPIGFLVLKSGVSQTPEEVSKEAVAIVREKIGPVAAFKVAIIIPRLPKTRSGKILRGTMRKIANKQEFTVPATIDDPAILDEIREAFEKTVK